MKFPIVFGIRCVEVNLPQSMMYRTNSCFFQIFQRRLADDRAFWKLHRRFECQTRRYPTRAGGRAPSPDRRSELAEKLARNLQNRK